MAIVYWDSDGIILDDYLEKGKTINGGYYAELLQQLSNKMKETWPHFAKKEVLLHQDDARTQKSTIPMVTVHKFRFELVPHSPYSTDMVPSYYHLFPDHLVNAKISYNSAYNVGMY